MKLVIELNNYGHSLEEVLNDCGKIFMQKEDSDYEKKTYHAENGAEIRRDIAQTERELKNLKRRDMELTALSMRLYEDNVIGKITNEVFSKLSDDYIAERKKSRLPFLKRKAIWNA